MRIIQTIKETFADGPGIRYSIYVSGCSHKCKGCHNPESWDLNKGRELNKTYIEEIKEEILSSSITTGITISGGDPLMPENRLGTLYLLNRLSNLGKDIRLYTGYTFGELLEEEDKVLIAILKQVDVLIDGKYEESLRDTSDFKGSTNQNTIKTKRLLEHIDV